jgi:hypothetical protein
MKLIISGGQTGADEAALRAAKLWGIPTGGWMPKGWRTLDGPKPQFEELYGMKEHSSTGYKERTWDNVFQADLTVRFAKNFNSAGEKCTLNAIKAYDKRFADIEIQDDKTCKLVRMGRGKMVNPINGNLAQLLLYLDDLANTVNIAGNSEQTSPGISKTVFKCLVHTFVDMGLLIDGDMDKTAMTYAGALA